MFVPAKTSFYRPLYVSFAVLFLFSPNISCARRHFKFEASVKKNKFK